MYTMSAEDLNALYETRREQGASEQELLDINSHALDCCIEAGDICFSDVGFPGNTSGGGTILSS